MSTVALKFGMRALAQDLEAESKTGRWMKIEGDEVEFLCRRMGGANKAYVAAVGAALRPLRAKMNAGTLEAADLRAAMIPLVAQHVVIGWRNAVDEAGESIPYSPEALEALLKDPEMGANYYDGIAKFAEAGENYRKAVTAAEDQLKND